MTPPPVYVLYRTYWTLSELVDEAGASSPHPGRNFCRIAELNARLTGLEEATMHGIIYIVGLIVVILAILSFFGLR